MTISSSTTFYEALPKHKAELVDGQLYIGGSLAKSAMALGYMVHRLGARYVADLVPEALLRDAVIEVYGKPGGSAPAMADFSPVSPSGYVVQRLANDLRMELFMQRLEVWGGEVKFEMMDGVPVFGGGDQTTREWLALLIMTLGVVEAVKYLPKEDWSRVL